MWSAFAQFKKNADAEVMGSSGCERATSGIQRPVSMQ